MTDSCPPNSPGPLREDTKTFCVDHCVIHYRCPSKDVTNCPYDDPELSVPGRERSEGK